jgi:hypothetical protein
MSLATQCSYPHRYFDILSEPSDEDLEIERNDIRDLLRTITTANSGGLDDAPSTSSSSPKVVAVCLHILHRLLTACQEVITVAVPNNNNVNNNNNNTIARVQLLLFPETAAHAFSSLAKPLYYVAESYVSNNDRSDITKQILSQALTILVNMCIIVTRAFQSSTSIDAQFHQLFPCCRIVSITIASITPMLSCLCYDNDVMQNGVIQALPYLIECVILSIEQFPELYAPSILEHSMYEIRGAMRGPGGDDHVGCLALKRLSTESDILTQHVIVAIKPFINRLCYQLEKLKNIELSRGKGIAHGITGVTSQSRRILLNILCTLELKSQATTGMSNVLSAMYNSTLDTICSFRSDSFDEQTLFHMCETALDIAMFPPEVVLSIFCSDDNDKSTQSLHILATACIRGYSSNIKQVEANKEVRKEGIVYFFGFYFCCNSIFSQWVRLRAALFMMIQRTATHCFPLRASEILISFIRAECLAIETQCSLGPNNISSIFCEDAINCDGIPAGLYIKVLSEAIVSVKTASDMQKLSNVINIICDCKDVVLACITHRCPDPGGHAFSDPRPTLAESWFLLMSNIIDSMPIDSNTELILIDSFAAFVSMLFYPSMEKTLNARRMDPGMSLDGAQSLAALLFVERFLRLGHDMLYKAGQKLHSIIPVDVDEFRKWHGDVNLVGTAIIGAAFFRANQGALAPWAVETVPEMYSAFFQSLRKDVSLFTTIIRLSMEIRMSPLNFVAFPSLKPGQLLSGRIFEGISEKAKISFVTDVMTVCQKDDLASWRRMKAIVKQACGGKKKETDFSQKPSFTKWEFFRI